MREQRCNCELCRLVADLSRPRRVQESIVDRIDARFVSGNEIPVPSILLTREQWAEIKAHVASLFPQEKTL